MNTNEGRYIGGITHQEGELEYMNTVFIAGHARLPSGMAAQNMYETLTITAEIDKKYGVIITASCTLATLHGQDFVQQLLKGI